MVPLGLFNISRLRVVGVFLLARLPPQESPFAVLVVAREAIKHVASVSAVVFLQTQFEQLVDLTSRDGYLVAKLLKRIFTLFVTCRVHLFKLLGGCFVNSRLNLGTDTIFLL